MFIEPKIQTHCYSSYREPEEYGAWGDSNSVNFEGEFTLRKKKSYGVEATEFDVAKGDVLYMVFAVWSTGDSFGTSENGSHECVQLYKTEEKAQKAAAILRGPSPHERHSMEFDDWTVQIETETGDTLAYFRPWLGHFESLSSLEVLSGVVVE